MWLVLVLHNEDIKTKYQILHNINAYLKVNLTQFSVSASTKHKNVNIVFYYSIDVISFAIFTVRDKQLRDRDDLPNKLQKFLVLIIPRPVLTPSPIMQHKFFCDAHVYDPKKVLKRKH